MKFNLKNRPRLAAYGEYVPSDDVIEIIKWFEGFEKEIRKRSNDVHKHYTDDNAAILINEYLEILGE